MSNDTHNKPTGRQGAVDYEHVDSGYLEQRQLKQGTAGWILLAGLGVSYVISGDFAGWNFGFAQGGFGGMLTVVHQCRDARTLETSPLLLPTPRCGASSGPITRY